MGGVEVEKLPGPEALEQPGMVDSRLVNLSGVILPCKFVHVISFFCLTFYCRHERWAAQNHPRRRHRCGICLELERVHMATCKQITLLLHFIKIIPLFEA